MPMEIPLAEAVVMYARASRAWFGAGAVEATRWKIDEAQARGDSEGVRVWREVLRGSRPSKPTSNFG